ncbi:MAG TPA: UDP-glucose 4-epimerase GalE [Patescibacteria group bacterium]|nr:UDP-glucose 4-epimerase GalE [Patescibacteria group bacterium]
MRVLVTGGAGYVGSVSVEALVASGHDVLVLDDLSTGHRAAVAPAARLVEGSYVDAGLLRALLHEWPVDAVLHCAARALVGESVANPALYYRDNVAGGVVLLEALRGAGIRRLVFSSTAAIYGTPTTVPIREDAVHAPINPYGETKRAFEGALRWYGGAYGLRSVSLRYFNVAGASARNGEDHDPETHLIPNVLAAVEGRGAVTVFGTDYPTADGTCVRDYIHVEDLARAHLLALEATAPDEPEGTAAIALNLGNGGGFSVREVLAAVEAATGRPVPHRIGARRAGDPPVLIADANRARALLGWEPAHADLEEIVASAWAWRRAHPAGYGA